MTIGFDNKNGYWKSTYSFNTMCFANINKRFVSFRDVVQDLESNDQNICYPHTEGSLLNTYFGNQASSIIAVSFNDNTSNNKVFKSLSIEGGLVNENQDQINFFRANSDNSPNKIAFGGRLREKGGVLYGHVGTVSTDTNTNISVVGLVKSITEFPQTPQKSLIELYNPDYSNVTNESLFFFVSSDERVWARYSNDFLESPGSLVNNNNYEMTHNWFDQNTNLKPDPSTSLGSYIDGSSIRVDWPFSGYEETNPLFTDKVESGEMMLFCVTPSSINGDQPKGQYAEAWFVLPVQSVNGGFEINAINLNYETVSADHSK